MSVADAGENDGVTRTACTVVARSSRAPEHALRNTIPTRVSRGRPILNLLGRTRGMSLNITLEGGGALIPALKMDIGTEFVPVHVRIESY